MSSAAIEKYLNKSNLVSVPIKYSSSGKGKRNYNLSNNLSVIMVTESIHERGRTWSGLNAKRISEKDSTDLLLATEKDIATTAYRIKYAFLVNKIYNDKAKVVDFETIDYDNNAGAWEKLSEQYIESSMTIYRRNSHLCLYYKKE